MQRYIFLVLVAITIAFVSPAMAQWNIHTVDNSGIVGEWSSIAYDSQGYPHIAYYNRTQYELMYAYWNGTGGWVIETVDDAGSDFAGQYCALAVDQFDRPHIAYLVLDNGGSYHYCSYATKTESGAWSKECLRNGQGWFFSIDLTYDPIWDKVVPHIAYWYSGALCYAYKDPESGWQTEPVDEASGVGYWTSIALDSNERVYISYYDYQDKDLKFAFFDGSEWGTFIVDGLYEDVGEFTSLVLDAAGDPHITYYDATNKDLKHATISLGSLLTGTGATRSSMR